MVHKYLQVETQSNTCALYYSIYLQFLDPDRIVTASSTGAVTIFRHHQNNQVLAGEVVYFVRCV